jgi:hypothetical protein
VPIRADNGKTKRQRRREGDVLAIDLENSEWGYGRVLGEADFAFYDLRSTGPEHPELARIVSSKVLFIVPVMDRAVVSGRWPVIGRIPLEPTLLSPPKYFRQDPFTGAIDYYLRGGFIAGPPEEALRLERCAVWEPEHIEKRP